MTIANAVWIVGEREKAVLTDTAQVYGGGREMFQSHVEQAELARAFTRIMHSRSMGQPWRGRRRWTSQATAYPGCGRRLGRPWHRGGTALATSARHRVRMPPVCEVARRVYRPASLAGAHPDSRGRSVAGPVPNGGCPLLLDDLSRLAPGEVSVSHPKSFESLPPGGRLIIHETLYNDEKTGPFPVAASSINMLLWTEGEEYSGHELSAMLARRDSPTSPCNQPSAPGVLSPGASRNGGPHKGFPWFWSSYGRPSITVRLLREPPQALRTKCAPAV